ncbi:MAG: DUF2288 domain-containing protein [Alcanivoracaceae bacterium]|nr:DUF2288 domain-containing protein [Alcanivoracaceae bacterium]
MPLLGTMRASNDLVLEVYMTDESDLKTRLNRETARISWLALQPHFARGNTVFVSPDLDLIDVAGFFADDNADEIQRLMLDQRVALVSEAQALQWSDAQQDMWAVVIAPWVLVQPVMTH